MTRSGSIRRYYETCWGRAGETSSINRGPMFDLPADFDVVVFPPHGDRTMWTYATIGMAQPGDDAPIELHLFAPHRSEAITKILYAMAHYHRTGTRLGLGDSVNFGRSWLPEATCDHGLIALPYLDGPALEVGTIGGDTVHFYWLVPITAAEKAYKARHGLEALEMRFEEGGLDYCNPARPSMV